MNLMPQLNIFVRFQEIKILSVNLINENYLNNLKSKYNLSMNSYSNKK